MAGVKKCLGVDIGSDSVKIAEMAIDKGGVRIIRLVSGSIPVGVSAMESERTTATVATIKNLIKTNKIATKNAAFSIAGQTVVVRHGQRVPQAPQPRLQQIIHFEARQQIAIPPEQGVVEYQVFETDNPHEVEVLLAAMKKETNQEFMNLVRRTGLRPIAMVPSHLALFNGQALEQYTGEKPSKAGKKPPAQKAKGKGLFGVGGGAKKASKPKKKKGAKDEPEAPVEEIPMEPATDDLALGTPAIFEEIRAYINIGARMTDLAITQAGGGKSAGFTRSIPIGGNHISAAILKNCQCDTFAQAEQLKQEKTAVLSGMFELEADKEKFNPKACTAATAVADRLIAELRRSLDYFISQPYGMAVDAIVLSGGGTSLPYLDSYIEERLGLPVTIAKTFGNERIKTPTQYSEGFDFSPYRIALGLASQGLAISPVKIDFLPSDIRAMRDFSGQSLELVILAALVGGMIFFSSQIGSKTMNEYRQQAQELSAKAAKLKPQIDLSTKAQKDRDAIADKVKALGQTMIPRDFWLRFYAELQRVKPPEILITQVAPNPDYGNPIQWDVEVGGEAERNSVVPAFVDQLKASKYIKGVEFSSISQDPENSDRFNKPVYKFKVVAQVQDIGGGVITRLLSNTPTATPTPVGGGPMDMGSMMSRLMGMGMGGPGPGGPGPQK